MPQGVQALLALLILLPGFVSARIARAISAPSLQTELERVIEALIFSFFTYVFYLGVFGGTLPIEWVATVDPMHAAHYSVRVFRGRLLFLSLVAIALGVSWGILQYHDTLLRFLRSLQLTGRTNDVSIWNGVLRSVRGTVQVGLADGRNVQGWLKRYSDAVDERALFLEDAGWISDDGVRTEIPGPGILLTDKAEVRYVMVLDSESQPLEGESLKEQIS